MVTVMVMYIHLWWWLRLMMVVLMALSVMADVSTIVDTVLDNSFR